MTSLPLRMVSCSEPPPRLLNRLPPLLYVSSVDGVMSVYNSTCADNCSGHGDCYNGICLCEVQYSGGTCTDPNLSYYIAFSTVFYLICAVSFVQLLLCMKSEFQRMKSPSILKTFRITTQKALYVVICVATAIRGFYFSSPENATLQWAASLMSAYYPALITGSSLIVCFWAEAFHVDDVCLERPRFLGKSFIGFIVFNVITYSLLLAEWILIQFSVVEEADKVTFTSIFDGCFAFLMFIVFVFFLIYGVEVYFKVRGQFTQGTSVLTNMSQVHQSRIGLISQAVLLLVTVGFILSEVLGYLWKDKVPVLSRNCHEIMFRVVEMGVALWFPCVLWNCIRPEQLWILNPRKLFRKLDGDKTPTTKEVEALVSPTKDLSLKAEISHSRDKLLECWICYDTECKDLGPLIHPCGCKGDVSAVHHDCLKKWLMESSTNPNNVKCKVCNEQYQLQRGNVCLPAGLTITTWLQTTGIVSVMCFTVAGAYLALEAFTKVEIRLLAVGLALLVEYVCLRLLGFRVFTAYQRAKFSAVKIVGRKLNGSSKVVMTVSHVKPQDGFKNERLIGNEYDQGMCRNTDVEPTAYLVATINADKDAAAT